MRRKIRITESQLRRTVNEAVRGLLSELDWKTYSNAANKSFLRGDGKRGADFANAAIMGFDDKHGRNTVMSKPYKSVHAVMPYQDNKWHGSPHVEGEYEEEIPNKVGLPDNYTDTAKRYAGSKYSNRREYGNKWQRHNGWLNNDPFERNFNGSMTDFYGGDENYARAYTDAENEIDNYRRGNYEYRKGQGWRLKNESRRRRGRLLRESEEEMAQPYRGMAAQIIADTEIPMVDAQDVGARFEGEELGGQPLVTFAAKREQYKNFVPRLNEAIEFLNNNGIKASCWTTEGVLVNKDGDIHEEVSGEPAIMVTLDCHLGDNEWDSEDIYFVGEADYSYLIDNGAN